MFLALLNRQGDDIGALGVQTGQEKTGVADVEVGNIARADRLTVDPFLGEQAVDGGEFLGGTLAWLAGGGVLAASHGQVDGILYDVPGGPVVKPHTQAALARVAQ